MIRGSLNITRDIASFPNSNQNFYPFKQTLEENE